MRREYPTGHFKPEITLNRADLDWVEKASAELSLDIDYGLSLTVRPILALKSFLLHRGIKVNWDIDMEDIHGKK